MCGNYPQSSLFILKIDVHWQITRVRQRLESYVLISPTHRQKHLYCWVWAEAARLCWTRPWLSWTRLKGCSPCTAAASRKKRSCAGPEPNNYSRTLLLRAPSAEKTRISQYEMWKVLLEKYVIYFGHGWLRDTNLQGSIHQTWTFKCSEVWMSLSGSQLNKECTVTGT